MTLRISDFDAVTFDVYGTLIDWEPAIVAFLRQWSRRHGINQKDTDVVRERGHVSEEDVRAVKTAGYDDAQVIEIVLHVALNTWTNYVNEVAKTDIDFPVVTARAAH